MDENTSETLFPCPFSKGYGIPARQAWALLKVFLIYRLILASLFIALLYHQGSPSFLAPLANELYIYSSQAYLILTVISIICIFWRLTEYTTQAQLLIFTDIILLTLLMHACGGIKSGIGVLLAVSIASGGLLIGGLCAMLFAALASLAVLTEQIYTSQAQDLGSVSYTYSGMLGATFFTIALLSYVLAKRSEEALQLADQQKQTIVNLEDLNQYIIQHLQSGIIIIDRHQTVQMVNEAALRLTDKVAAPQNLSDISAYLSQAFSVWLSAPKTDSTLLPIPRQPEIYSRFMSLSTSYDFFYLIILEDVTLYNQRLQQSKLASLGRLTASIAHEIRNPLGAISHAGQLLSENRDLSQEDQRLTAIIQTHCNRVNRIIEDILQLSRRNDSRREKIHLQPWLVAYLDEFMMINDVAPDTFRLSQATEPLYAFIDANHLKQIMDNLCQNALRYGKPGWGRIVLHSFISQHSPCVEIIDSGPGISAEHLNHLFEPFFTTSPSGTGLGLYISKELAELNQAKLSYYLTDDNRSCFRLCLMDAEKNLIEL
ncbi:MAG: ATP-binding protein [Methylovulum sp.]|nr:ATP-binding protein [Methylovulum sp.]